MNNSYLKNILVLFVCLFFSLSSFAHVDPENEHEEEQIELIFALDASGSLELNNFRLQQQGFKEALDNLIDQGVIGNISTISVIYFANNAIVEANKSESLSDIKEALSIDYSKGSTNMTAAFEKAGEIVDSILVPDPDGHTVHKLLILSTDGQPANANQSKAEADKLIAKDVTIASIGVSSGADSIFLDSFSNNSPVPIPTDFSDFGNVVTKVIFSELSEALGIPVVTSFSSNSNNMNVDLNCEGAAFGFDTISYEYEIYDSQGNSIVNETSSENDVSFSLSSGEGIYSASCNLLATSSGTEVRSELKYIHFPVLNGSIIDSDGDGLPDLWEEQGVKDSNGIVILDLPAMGADSQCKDLFLEVDWIGDSRLSRGAFEKVITSFSEAPVYNPGNNCKGINLHIDAGFHMTLHFDKNSFPIPKVVVQNYPTKGNEIVDVNGSIADNLTSKSEFIKQSKLNFSSLRNGIFRYSIIIPRELFKSSGYAYAIPGPGFFSHGLATDKINGFRWTENKAASTFMHEFGHTLGLGHGGIMADGEADHDNYKPNYFSIMNYSYQLPLLGGGIDGKAPRFIDFSRWHTNDLNEQNLDEFDGVGLKSTPDNDLLSLERLSYLTTRYSCPENLFSFISINNLTASDPIDWDCDGDYFDNNVSNDINYRNKPFYNSGEKSILKGAQHTDWSKLKFGGQGVNGLGAPTIFELETSLIDTSVNEDVFTEPSLPYEAFLTGNNVYDVVPSKSYTLDYTLANTGELDDSYLLSVLNKPDGFITSVTPSTNLTLPTKESRVFQLEFTVPRTTQENSQLMLSVQAVSNSNPSISESIDLVMNVGSLPPNTDPVAVADNEIAILNQSLTTSNVLLNDTDADGDTLLISEVDALSTEGGAIDNNNNGTFTYTPPAGFTGFDGFEYTISDGNGGSAVGNVLILVTGPDNNPPIAVDDIYSTFKNSTLDINVLSNDSDPDQNALTVGYVESFTTGQGGAVFTYADGFFIYEPAINFAGEDSFTYLVSDSNGGESVGTVRITVLDNSAPIAIDDVISISKNRDHVIINVISNDSDPDSDNLSILLSEDFSSSQGGVVSNNGNGSFTYYPVFGFVGEDSFGYTLSDSNGGTDIGSVRITVLDNLDPVAVEDFVTVIKNASVIVDVVSNDYDPDQDTFSLYPMNSFNSLEGGSVDRNADNTFTYYAPADFVGEDSFNYYIEDPSRAGASGTVRVSVTDGPKAGFDIDGDGDIKPLSDGLLILRYLFGFRDQSLISNTITSSATRTSPTEIEEYIKLGIDSGLMDVDKDNEVKALTDGLLILRYLFGFSGGTLINNVIGENATVSSAEDIEIYLFFEITLNDLF